MLLIELVNLRVVIVILHFSTTWVKDIKKNGAYEGLISDGRNHFTHPHDSSQLYKFNETNPYIEAFFKWWESDLHHTLRRITHYRR